MHTRQTLCTLTLPLIRGQTLTPCLKACPLAPAKDKEVATVQTDLNTEREPPHQRPSAHLHLDFLPCPPGWGAGRNLQTSIPSPLCVQILTEIMSTGTIVFNKLQDASLRCLYDANRVLFYFTVLLNSHVCFVLIVGPWKSFPCFIEYCRMCIFSEATKMANLKYDLDGVHLGTDDGGRKNCSPNTSRSLTSVLSHWVGPSDRLWPWIVSRSAVCGFQPGHLIKP